VALLSRGEHRQAEVARLLEPFDTAGIVRMFVGDVRDRMRLERAMRGIEWVVHAAALKRIEVGNYAPDEMMRTNVVGSQNVIDAAHAAGVKKVILLSSDKAFHPVSAYGFSKAMAESLFLMANNTRGWGGPIHAVTRYGNVWRSAGSVEPRWRAILAGGGTSVPVTDPECTRFFMTMDQAVDLVFDTLHRMKGGELAIPRLPAYRLGDLADAMGAKMDVRGLPAWEKLHESMAEGNSSDRARRMTMAELTAALEKPVIWQ
jgi:UDP-N-acetylglucosamine 4,6-dehydratase/5-epimerase